MLDENLKEIDGSLAVLVDRLASLGLAVRDGRFRGRKRDFMLLMFCRVRKSKQEL